MLASEPRGEDKRLALMNRLIEALGEEAARTLMESLPPVLWTHLATKDDLRALEDRLCTAFNGKFDKLTAQTTGEFARVHARIDGLEGRMDAKFESMEAKFESATADFKSWRAETALMLAKQTRTMAFMLVGFALSIWIPLFFVGLS